MSSPRDPSATRRLRGPERLCATLLVVLAALSLAAPRAASAQATYDPPTAEGFTHVPRTGGELELGFWSAGLDDSRVGSFSGLAMLGIALDNVLELRLRAGFGFGDFDPSLFGLEGDAASAANPLLEALGIVSDRRIRLRFGAGITFPVAPPSNSARQAAFFAAATRGLADYWLWASERVSLVPAFELMAVPVDHLYLEFNLRAGVIFPTSLSRSDRSQDVPITPLEDPSDPNAQARSDVDLTIDTSAAIGYRHENFLGGVRLRGVFSPTWLREEVQTSVSVFARGSGTLPGTSVELYGGARLETNLDPGLGFGFAPLGYWGLFFNLGVAVTPREIAPGRYGVAEVQIEGVNQVDQQSILACLGTRRRPQFAPDIGPRGTPECGEPPFDGGHAIIPLWHWPWAQWPLFDENVMERDVERIERWYRARGFYDANVTAVNVDPPEATAVDDPSHHCEDGEECTVSVSFTVEEGEAVTIRRMSIRFIGEEAEQVESREDRDRQRTTRRLLRAELALSPGDRFDEALFDRTKTRMLRVLADHGFAHARVSGRVKVNRRRHEVTLIFNIDAGPPSVIGRVCVSGYGSLPPGSLLGISGLSAGQQFSLAALEDAQRSLYALGVFSGVDVRPREDAEEIAAAQAAEADDAVETNDESERTTVSRDDVAVSIGERQVFCADGPAVVAEGHDAVEIRMRVTPGRIERAGFGIGLQAGQAVTLGSQSGLSYQEDAAQWDLHVSASYEHRNVADNLIRTRLEVRPRLIFQMPVFNFQPAQDPPLGLQAVFSNKWPAFLGERHTTLSLQIQYDLGPMPFTNFFRSELIGALGPEWSLFDSRLYIGLFVHGNWFLPTDRQPVNPRHALPETGSAWLEQVLRVDLRDSAINPTAGFFFSASAQQSVQPLSSWDLLRVTAEARGYVPLFDTGIVIAGRFEIGVLEVLGASDNLDRDNVYQQAQLGPPRLTLRGGGASSNRGYLPGLLGDATQVYVTLPRSDEELRRGAPIRSRPVRISGGTRLWEASLEVRIPVTTNVGVVVFADAGDVARPSIGGSADFRFDHPQIALGLGVRYRTIIGPLRLDIAFRPDALQVIGESQLPPTCQTDRAVGCNPRNFIPLFDFPIPAAYHLSIGESF